MTPSPAKKQRGVVLIAMLAVIVMSAAWFTVSRLNALSGDFTAASRNYNAALLNRVKQTLIGHIAMQAAKAGEDDPGYFPCPEASGNVGGSLEGAVAGNCTLPAVGRLPWRTIGMEKPLDASGEALWYVVSPGWALSNSTAPPLTTYINSDSLGQLTAKDQVDGTTYAAVAFIIAPGPAMNVQANPGCTARNQSRSTPSPAINPLDYLECYNSAAATFSTRAPATSFNDQVVTITAAEVLPAIEAAIADRIQHEIAPRIRTAYSGGLWAASTVLPFAAPFGNPTTSNFKGSAASLRGLLPLNYAFTASPGSASACSPAPCTPTPCTVGPDPRCDPAFVAWQSATMSRTAGGQLGSYSCSVAGTPSILTCTIYTYDFFVPNNTMTFNLVPKASNVGMALRQINTSVTISGLDATYNAPYGYSATALGSVINNDGSASIALSARVPQGGGTGLLPLINPLCGVLSIFLSLGCYKHTVTVPMALLSDHPLVDPSNSSYNWFTRNKWQEVSYYAVAAGIAPSGARSCTNAVDCLQVTHHPNDGKQRGVILLGGAKLGTQNRPPTTVADLFEGANADGASPFELRSATLLINRSFNDRVAAVDSNP